jgi:LAO/AO transport system kinase
MSDEAGLHLLKAARAGDKPAFAKFLTWLEKADVNDALAVEALMKPTAAAFRIGITGPPGAGKSTIVNGLIGEFRARGKKVGVIAVDPSSPFSRGAILGDRIRYADHVLDAGVFIRSLGTRGSLGGLSSAAFLMARAFDACGYDLVLIETVGVGQTELDVLHVADQVCVVLVPESGDSIQAMKAGLMEIADIFVINKADRPGAAGLAREIESAAGEAASRSGKTPVVLMCVATEGRGLGELAEKIALSTQSIDPLANRHSPGRLREEARALLRREWERSLEPTLASVRDVSDLRTLFRK